MSSSTKDGDTAMDPVVHAAKIKAEADLAIQRLNRPVELTKARLLAATGISVALVTALAAHVAHSVTSNPLTPPAPTVIPERPTVPPPVAPPPVMPPTCQPAPTLPSQPAVPRRPTDDATFALWSARMDRVQREIATTKHRSHRLHGAEAQEVRQEIAREDQIMVIIFANFLFFIRPAEFEAMSFEEFARLRGYEGVELLDVDTFEERSASLERQVQETSEAVVVALMRVPEFTPSPVRPRVTLPDLGELASSNIIQNAPRNELWVRTHGNPHMPSEQDPLPTHEATRSTHRR